MSGQASFRSVIKPLRKTISTNVAGSLDFEDKFTIIEFTAAQGSNILNLLNLAHLIDGQTIAIFNLSASDIIVDASLFINGVAIDIEEGTTSFLYYDKLTSKFIDQGGTSRIKNIEEDFAAHIHNGTDVTKILGTNIDPSTSLSDYVLSSDGSGNAIWKYHPPLIRTIAIYSNTNVLTDLNTTLTFLTEVPLTGTAIETNAAFTLDGNGFIVNFTGRIKAYASCLTTSTATKADVHYRFNSSASGLFGPTQTNFVSVGADLVGNSLEATLPVTTGDKITLLAKKAGAASVVTLESIATSGITIERIPV